jgi:hypothetical protein
MVIKYIFCIGLIFVFALVNVLANEEVVAGFFVGFALGAATVLIVIWR